MAGIQELMKVAASKGDVREVSKKVSEDQSENSFQNELQSAHQSMQQPKEESSAKNKQKNRTEEEAASLMAKTNQAQVISQATVSNKMSTNVEDASLAESQLKNSSLNIENMNK